MALSLVFTKRFKKDAKKAQRRGKDLAKMRAAICALQSEEPLAASLQDHALSGDWADHRELHLEPDWLLVYRVAGSDLWLVRTGSHSDLF